MTVSRALRDDSPVNKDTRARILQVVREMNYVPDQMAGSLTTKKSGFVAVLVPSLNNLHFAETVQALTDVLEEFGHQILLGYTNYSASREEKLIETMLRRRPEAVVLSYDGHSDRTLQLLTDAQIPVVELWERPEEPVNHTIGFSNRAAAAAMTRTLLGQGYTRIVFLSEGGDDWTRGAARRAGYLDAIAEVSDLEPRVMQTGKPPLSIEQGAAVVPDLLQRFPDADCIFCVSDMAAFGVQSRLMALGHAVPDDIGVAGFGNFEVSRFASPAISTVVVDPHRIGRETGALIGKLLSDDAQSGSPIHVDVDPVPVLRASTRKS